VRLAASDEVSKNEMMKTGAIASSVVGYLEHRTLLGRCIVDDSTGKLRFCRSKARWTSARLEPLLSMVTVSGAPFLAMALSKKRRAAALSRLALNKKSMVLPALSTAR